VSGIDDPFSSLESGRAAEHVKLPANAPKNLSLFIFRNRIAMRLVIKIDRLVMIIVRTIVLMPSLVSDCNNFWPVLEPTPHKKSKIPISRRN
jgi:hypothetical protein